MPFQSLGDVHAMLAKLPSPDPAAIAAAQARNGQLTKPPGALGRLEQLAVWMAGWQGTDKPTASRPQIVIFAGNHGVTAKGVSAFPAEVTVQMVANFAHGGAAINQLARAFGAKLDVHPLDLDRPTADFTEGPAMTEAEVMDALRKGFEAVNLEADLFVATACAARRLPLQQGWNATRRFWRTRCRCCAALAGARLPRWRGRSWARGWRGCR